MFVCLFVDENECKYRPCDVFAHCTNTMGSYYCSCFPGYEGDGFSCKGMSWFVPFCCSFHLHCVNTLIYENVFSLWKDTNECELPSLAAMCAENAECCNLPGHFVCKCKPGFTGNATVSCTGTIISGYIEFYFYFLNLPTKQLTDINECLDPNNCGRGAICENTAGSYICTCPIGFEGDPAIECWGKWLKAIICVYIYILVLTCSE